MKKGEFENEEVENKVSGGKSKSDKKIKALIGIIAIILIIAVAFGLSYLSRERSIERADRLISIEKYDEGIAIYDKLLSKEHSETLMDKRNSAVEIKESDENLKNGLEAYEEGDINKAVKLLNRVTRDDEKRYKAASEELRNIEETILIDVYQLIEDGDLDRANEMVNNYLKGDSKNVKMQNAKEAIRFEKSETAKQDEITGKDQEDTAKEEDKEAELDDKDESESESKNKNTNKNAKVEKVADGIVGTYQSIVAGKANLRDGSSLNSSIVSVLRSGDEVYIHDTYIESAERIWCYVSTQKSGDEVYGWISYNTMNYNIQ